MNKNWYRALSALFIFVLFAGSNSSAAAEKNTSQVIPAGDTVETSTSTPTNEIPIFKISKPAPLPTPSCPIQKEIDALDQAIRKPQPDYLDQLRIELNIRKLILNKVIDCALEEAKSLQINLTDKKTEDTGLEKLRTNLISELDRIINYYSSQKTVAASAGLRSSRELAGSLREWRTSTYGPAAQTASNLLLWIKNDNLLLTADIRADQIYKTVNFLHLKDDEKISPDLDIARTALAASRKEHTQARDLLVTRNDESLTHLKASLIYLSDAYSSFFNISDMVNKLLKL